MEMKRNSIIAAAVCLAALASCQKQEIVESPSLAKVDVELTASSDLNSTKTVMTEYNNHWWSVSDKISLFYKVDGTSTVRHSVFTSKNLIPSATARFAGTLSLPAEDTDLKTVSAIAVYPAAAEGASSDGTSVTVTVPAVQTAVEGTFMEGAYPVVAQTSDLTAALSFKAVCGGVKVSFQTPGITSFTFDAKGAKIAGTASVKIGEDGTPVATLGENAVSEITVNAPAGGFEVGKWYYMTALPATLAGGYTITLSNGKSFGSTSSIAIKRSVFGVLDSKDAPDTYADIKGHLKPISWWDTEKNNIQNPLPAYSATDRERERVQANNNASMVIKSVKFISDESYVYGYIEAEGNDATRLSNLGLWIDVDGDKSEEQGGGWLFTLYKYFDKIAYGAIGADGNRVWSPKLRISAKGSPWLGDEIAISAPGYGEGSYENNIFKYSIVLDRRVIGIRNQTTTVIGINFDNGKGTGIGDFTNPDRGGYVFHIKNSDLVTVDENTILKHIKSFDDWANLDYVKLNNTGNNKADTKLKFDSDSDYIYGYIEVPNTDNLYVVDGASDPLPNGPVISFCPGFIKKFAVGFDLDGVESGQGISHLVGNCWELVLNGDLITYTTPLSDEDKNNGWVSRWGHYAMYRDKFDAETTVRPNYTITPKVWNPQLCESTGGVGTVRPDAKDWQNFATGNGEWKNKIFRYSFTIDRGRLDLKGLSEVKLGVILYETNLNDGYTVVPDAAGITIKLNNN